MTAHTQERTYTKYSTSALFAFKVHFPVLCLPRTPALRTARNRHEILVRPVMTRGNTPHTRPAATGTGGLPGEVVQSTPDVCRYTCPLQRPGAGPLRTVAQLTPRPSGQLTVPRHTRARADARSEPCRSHWRNSLTETSTSR